MPVIPCSEPGCNQLIEASCENIVVLFSLKNFLQNIRLILPDTDVMAEQTDKQLEQVEEKIKDLKLEDEEQHYQLFVNSKIIKAPPLTKQKVLTLKCLKGHSNIYTIDCPL